jgi:uncharacterized repeat protein (TIGR01451 family)
MSASLKLGLLVLLTVATDTAADDPNLDYLFDGANRYTVSGNPADLSHPIIPIFSDFYSGGMYFGGGLNFAPPSLVRDSNDPDAGRGLSSFRMTWDGNDGPAYVGLKLGVNRPRDIPAFGMARNLRFLAKSDFANRQLWVNVLVGGSSPQTLTKSFVVGQNWADYNFELPPLTPKDISEVQLKISQSGTFRFDEVRFDTDGFDPARIVQSYRPLWASAGSPGGSVAYRDAYVYPNRAFLYDNALAIQALIARGTPAALALAKDVADAVVSTARPDGSFYNERDSGHTLLADGSPRPPYSERRYLGDNAWIGLAFVDLYRATAQIEYLTRARGISDWAENSLKVPAAVSALKGYRGGYDSDTNPVGWRSIEHNADLFQLNRRLSVVLLGLDDTAAQAFAVRATHAADFVLHPQLFDNATGHFWTGTGIGDAINYCSIPLDAQFWTYLTLGQWPEYAGAIDWRRPIQWARSNLWRTDGPFTGYTYSSASTPGRVWFEGNAFAAVAYQLQGEVENAQEALGLLEQARLQGPNADPGGRGQIAASADDMQDSCLVATYDARLAAAPTAWTYLARRRLNPFSLAVVPAVSATKTVSLVAGPTFAAGSTIAYTVTIRGRLPQADNPGNEFSDVLPAELTLISASATSGLASADVGTNTVTWNGPIAANGSTVTITIQASIKVSTPGGIPISNQGTINCDSDANGTNDATVQTDEPGLPGPADPTVFYVATRFYTLDPCRIVDTRGATAPLGGPSLGPGSRSFYLVGSCALPSDAKAVSLNVTVTGPTQPGDLRIYPSGSALPLVSTINYSPGQTRANNAIAVLSASGGLAVQCDQAAGTVDLILDVNGFFK